MAANLIAHNGVSLILRIGYLYFRAHGIESKVVDRFHYNNDVIEWADIIITAGGDGTYLLAASKVKVKNKPIIGVNTDPKR